MPARVQGLPSARSVSACTSWWAGQQLLGHADHLHPHGFPARPSRRPGVSSPAHGHERSSDARTCASLANELVLLSKDVVDAALAVMERAGVPLMLTKPTTE